MPNKSKEEVYAERQDDYKQEKEAIFREAREAVAANEEEEKEEISLNKETIEIVIKVQNLCGIGKGFWFKLEDILTKEYNEDDAKKNTIEKYLSNYQIGNKNLIYGSVDEDQWKKLSDDKKSKFNEERKNRRKSINKKIENVIEKIVEDIIEKEDEYRKLLRVNIIKINKKERR